ncbi:FAD-binding protein [Oribacterium sp. C9]|uniref:FAD-binding protein n=1 Tax=Oribacterium sp. C9 TaxID=1943579 RepID=UPI00098FE46C|nr:FAD-binding protein [Oribacterium sp. C9]
MSNKITRRDFLKGMSATAVIAGLGSLAGCSATEVPEATIAASSTEAATSAASSGAALYKPGTYTATAKGMGNVTMKATFSEDAITDIVLDVSEETEGIGKAAGDELIKQFMDAQNANIDGVSGATITTNAAKECLNDCIRQAGGTVVEVSEEEEELDLTPSRTVSSDAVVIGCGAAGIQAALVLQAAGKKTILLEKGGSCGISNGSVAGGPALAETRVQEAENATVTAETLYKCEYGFSRGTVNGSLLRKCVDVGERVVSNFMDNGVNMGLRRDAYGMGFRARHNFANLEGKQVKGVDRFQPLIDKFEADGGQFFVNSEALKLVKTGDAVTGVIVRHTATKEIVEYDAKAVLVATGGYAGNDKKLREIYGDITVWPLCNTLSTGQGYDMVIEAGGIADRNWALCCNEFGGANHKIPVQGPAMRNANIALEFAIYGGLIVNQNGDRFMNEQYLSDRPLALGGEMALREGKYYAVVDQEMFDTCRDKGILEYYGSPEDWYVGYTGMKDKVMADLDEGTETAIEQEWAAKGTLKECAKFFSMNNLEKTVEEYNALCDAKEDTQFFKAPYLLHKLSGDTYYVFEYEMSIWSTFGGVKTDDYARALTADQTPIPGLYVAGVDNGSLYCSPYYENEGAALGTAYTSGIVAADCMLEYLNA